MEIGKGKGGMPELCDWFNQTLGACTSLRADFTMLAHANIECDEDELT